VLLTGADQERVELVEEPGVVRQVSHEERLHGRVVRVRLDQPVPRQDPPRVGVDDEDRAAGRIQRDGVGGLRSDAGNPTKLGAERGEREGEQPAEASPVAPRHVPGEGVEPAGLHAKRPGGTDEPGEPRRGQREDAAEVEDSGGAEPRDRPLGVAPGGVLREDRPDHDLEAGARRPPALRAIPPMEAVVEPEQAATSRVGPWQEGRRRQHGDLIIRTTDAGRRKRALTRGLALAGLLLARAASAEEPLSLTVAVGAPAEDPAYLPVHAAVALGTFEAEGVRVTLKRAKHPTGAVAALRDRETGIAVTTLDEAIRGAWARKIPVQVLAAHVRAPAVALLVAPAARDTVRRVEDLRGKPVGIPGPGTTGHLLLAAVLRGARIQPWQVDTRSVGSTALLAQLGTGDLAAAMVEEPWASRLLVAGRAGVLIDFRQPSEVERVLGGPFYEVVSVAVTPSKDDKDRKDAPKAGPDAKKEAPPRIEPPPEAALAAYARAVARVQAWLATTPPAAVAERLPPALVGDRARFEARLGALQAAYAGTGDVTREGLEATIRVLRGGGSPWPVSLTVGPDDLAPPPGVAEARRQLGASPPPP
jgi:ABC-type nitrate/sulfonate/bicarbonate transport system substrate-binding protein